MAKEKWSATVESILSALTIRRGDAEITEEEATNLYGGSLATTVGDLSKQELVQVALLEAYAIIEDMIAEQADQKITSLNRATRRSKK